VIPDGNGEFTEQYGNAGGQSRPGFGKRSWRYSMLVKDGVVEKMFIEPDEPGDPFRYRMQRPCSAISTPEAVKPKSVSLFAKVGCPFYASAKAMLKEHGIDYEEIVLGKVTNRPLRAVGGKKRFLKSLLQINWRFRGASSLPWCSLTPRLKDGDSSSCLSGDKSTR